MKLTVFSIFDAKAKAYLPPFYLHQPAQGIRAFIDSVNKRGHAFNAHPEDYTLFTLGTFDDEKAEFQLNNSPQALHNGLELVKNQPIDDLKDANHEEPTELSKQIQSST